MKGFSKCIEEDQPHQVILERNNQVLSLVFLNLRRNKYEFGFKTGLILGVSLIIAAVIFGSYFYQAQSPGQTITVVGAASQNFEADTVKWTLNIEEDILGENLSAGYKRLKAVRERIFSLLETKGIGRDCVTMKPVQVYKEYDYTAEARIFRGYRFQQTLYVITDQVDMVEKMASDPMELLNSGTINSHLEYFYSGLDELKKELVGAATKMLGNGRKDGGRH